MSGAGDSVPLFTPEEQEQIAAAAEEAQRFASEYVAWLRSPGGRAWGDQVLQECRAMAEEFKQDCAAGKYALSADELAQLHQDTEAFAEEVRTGKFDLTSDEIEQLRRDGVFVSHRKKGRQTNEHT